MKTRNSSLTSYGTKSFLVEQHELIKRYLGSLTEIGSLNHFGADSSETDQITSR